LFSKCRTLVHFFSTLFLLFFFTNNFCIALCLFSVTKLCERYQQELGAHIWWMGRPIKHIFVFTPSVGVERFWVDLNRMTCFCAYPLCRSSAHMGGVYVILILRAWQTSHKGQQSLTKLNTKAINIYVEFFLA
jgi:hypothetical protein